MAGDSQRGQKRTGKHACGGLFEAKHQELADAGGQFLANYAGEHTFHRAKHIVGDVHADPELNGIMDQIRAHPHYHGKGFDVVIVSPARWADPPHWDWQNTCPGAPFPVSESSLAARDYFPCSKDLPPRS